MTPPMVWFGFPCSCVPLRAEECEVIGSRKVGERQAELSSLAERSLTSR